MTAYVFLSFVTSAVALTWAFDPKRRGSRIGPTKPKRPPT